MGDTSTAAKIAAIRKRAEKATPGPWWIGEDQTTPIKYLWSLHLYAGKENEDQDAIDVAWFSCSEDGAQEGRYAPKLKRARANIDFAAHARTDIPALLAALDEAHGLLRHDVKIAVLNLLALEPIGERRARWEALLARIQAAVGEG